MSDQDQAWLVKRYGFVPTVSSIADYWTWQSGYRAVWQYCYDWMRKDWRR